MSIVNGVIYVGAVRVGTVAEYNKQCATKKYKVDTLFKYWRMGWITWDEYIKNR